MRGDLFGGLSIWEDKEYRKIQGTYSVITTTSKEYATSFGFTEEVFTALEDFGMGDLEVDVKKWYDGFIFGEHRDIYNPWPFLNFQDTGELKAYWSNSSFNRGKRKTPEEIDAILAEPFLTW